MPPKTGKRKPSAAAAALQAAAVAEEGPPARPKRPRPRAGALRDDIGDDRPDKSGDALVTQQQQDRTFWAQFDTPLLATWATQAPVLLPFHEASVAARGTLIDALVSIGAYRPAAKKELQQLQQLWREKWGLGTRSKAPGLIDDAEVVSSEEGEASEEDGHGGKRARLSGAAGGGDTAAATAPALAQAEAARPSSLLLPAVPSASRVCLVCAGESIGPPSGGWKCGLCGCMGNLAAEHPVNAKFLGTAAPVTPSSSYASSSTGQSSTQTPTVKLSRRDAELERLAELHQEHPKFASAEPFSHVDALSVTRQALLASGYEPPSPSLLKLVRLGTLTEVGLAIPRTFAEATSGADKVALTADGGGQLTARAAAVSRDVNSFAEFCHALFGTILPALVDKPQALAQWLSLAESVRACTVMEGWAVAGSFLRQSLHSCVPERKDFSPPNRTILEDARFLAGGRAAPPIHAQQHGATPQRPQRPQRPAGVPLLASGGLLLLRPERRQVQTPPRLRPLRQCGAPRRWMHQRGARRPELWRSSPRHLRLAARRQRLAQRWRQQRRHHARRSRPSPQGLTGAWR